MAGIGKGTPGSGRPPGSQNVITRELKAMILRALDDAGGQAYLTQQAHQNPVAFLALVGKVLPMTIRGDGSSPLTVQILTGVPRDDANG